MVLLESDGISKANRPAARPGPALREAALSARGAAQAPARARYARAGAAPQDAVTAAAIVRSCGASPSFACFGAYRLNAVAQRADTVRPVRAEEWSRAARLAYVVMPRYDEARLVRLLRLLRAPPLEWIRRAQRIPLEIGLRRERVAEATTLTDRDLTELGRRLERDPSFRQQFDVDPVAATEAAGMPELGSRLQREIRELVALAERVASDEPRTQRLLRTFVQQPLQGACLGALKRHRLLLGEGAVQHEGEVPQRR